MNCCVYLKKRKSKPFCKLKNKEIPFSCCQECDKKEYKNKSLQKSAELCKSNNHQIKKASGLNKKSPLMSGKMKNKSNKLAKLERNRFSVFTDDKKCFVCKSTYQLTWNEIFRGRNRVNSMKYGFCLRMCLRCHEKHQEDVEINDYWHRKSQQYFEDNIGSREEFLAIFRRNYLIKKKDLD